MNRIKEYRVEIKTIMDSADLQRWAANLWDVYVYITFESGDSVELLTGRYPTPIEAGKAAGEMDNFYKYLSPSLKTGV